MSKPNKATCRLHPKTHPTHRTPTFTDTQSSQPYKLPAVRSQPHPRNKAPLPNLPSQSLPIPMSSLREATLAPVREAARLAAQQTYLAGPGARRPSSAPAGSDDGVRKRARKTESAYTSRFRAKFYERLLEEKVGELEGEMEALRARLEAGRRGREKMQCEIIAMENVLLRREIERLREERRLCGECARCGTCGGNGREIITFKNEDHGVCVGVDGDTADDGCASFGNTEGTTTEVASETTRGLVDSGFDDWESPGNNSTMADPNTDADADAGADPEHAFDEASHGDPQEHYGATDLEFPAAAEPVVCDPAYELLGLARREAPQWAAFLTENDGIPDFAVAPRTA